MTLIIEQALWILLLGLIFVLLKLKDPPQDILKVIIGLMSATVVAIAFTASDIVKTQPFTATHKVYLSIALLLASVMALMYCRHIIYACLISSGIIFNMLAFMANNWQMPFFIDWEVYAKVTPENTNGLFVVMVQDSNLKPLCDWITIKLSALSYSLVGSTFSIGDILIIMGLFWGSWKIMNLYVDKKRQ